MAGPEDRPPRDRVLVFVDDLTAPALDDADRRHLERSLRLRPGDPLTIGDGAGSWRAARLGPDIEPDGPIHVAPPPRPELVVAFAPVKGDRSDLVVQKLTELGIDRVVPVRCERSVVRWDRERAGRQVERHRRIVREAAMQSRNPRPPRVEAQLPLDEALARWPGLAFADPDGGIDLVDWPGPAGTGSPNRPGDPQADPNRKPVRDQRHDHDHGHDHDQHTVIGVVVGPEGGFAPDELAGRIAVRLPGRILRTETAAITAGVLLALRR